MEEFVSERTLNLFCRVIETQNLRAVGSDLAPTGEASGFADEGGEEEEELDTNQPREEWGEDDGAEVSPLSHY